GGRIHPDQAGREHDRRGDEDHHADERRRAERRGLVTVAWLIDKRAGGILPPARFYFGVWVTSLAKLKLPNSLAVGFGHGREELAHFAGRIIAAHESFADQHGS